MNCLPIGVIETRLLQVDAMSNTGASMFKKNELALVFQRISRDHLPCTGASMFETLVCWRECSRAGASVPDPALKFVI